MLIELIFVLLTTNIKCLNLRNKDNNFNNQILLISFDGFGALYLDEFLKENPLSNLQQFINDGIKAEYMKPSFPTATFPNHITLVTGIVI
jgi:predicted AlkP superfamily pyrophosphatase or phosphodiesterase